MDNDLLEIAGSTSCYLIRQVFADVIKLMIFLKKDIYCFLKREEGRGEKGSGGGGREGERKKERNQLSTLSRAS